MKVAHLIPLLFSCVGGLQVCVHNICERHAQQGVEVYVFCGDLPPAGFRASYSVEKMVALTEEALLRVVHG